MRTGLAFSPVTVKIKTACDQQAVHFVPEGTMQSGISMVWLSVCLVNRGAVR